MHFTLERAPFLFVSSLFPREDGMLIQVCKKKSSQCCCDGDGSREVLRDDGNVESEGVPPPLSKQVVFRVLYDYRFFHAPAALVRRDSSARPSHASCWCVLSLTQPKRNPALILITATRVRSLSHGLAFFENARTDSYNVSDNRISSIETLCKLC